MIDVQRKSRYMFKKYFKFHYEKVYSYSYLITFISLFLPWLRGFWLYIPGIILPFGNVLIVLLLISAGLFALLKRQKKYPSVSSIIMGVLCFATMIGHLIGYRLVIIEGEGLFGFGIGVYGAIFGSLGIIVSGILGLKHKKNQ